MFVSVPIFPSWPFLPQLFRGSGTHLLVGPNNGSIVSYMTIDLASVHSSGLLPQSLTDR